MALFSGANDSGRRGAHDTEGKSYFMAKQSKPKPGQEGKGGGAKTAGRPPQVKNPGKPPRVPVKK
jgi:hypothetical protein